MGAMDCRGAKKLRKMFIVTVNDAGSGTGG